MKVLALDYGAARTGVAVSDPTGTLARPLRVDRALEIFGGLDALTVHFGDHVAARRVVLAVDLA